MILFEKILLHPQTAKPQTTSKNISQVTDVRYQTQRGVIAGYNNSILAIKTNGKNTNFNLSQTEDIQGIVSGSPENGNVVTVQTSKDEIRVGQEALIIFEKATNKAQSIYLFKKL